MVGCRALRDWALVMLAIVVLGGVLVGLILLLWLLPYSQNGSLHLGSVLVLSLINECATASVYGLQQFLMWGGRNVRLFLVTMGIYMIVAIVANSIGSMSLFSWCSFLEYAGLLQEVLFTILWIIGIYIIVKVQEPAPYFFFVVMTIVLLIQSAAGEILFALLGLMYSARPVTVTEEMLDVIKMVVRVVVFPIIGSGALIILRRLARSIDPGRKHTQSYIYLFFQIHYAILCRYVVRWGLYPSLLMSSSNSIQFFGLSKIESTITLAALVGVLEVVIRLSRNKVLHFMQSLSFHSFSNAMWQYSRNMEVSHTIYEDSRKIETIAEYLGLILVPLLIVTFQTHCAVFDFGGLCKLGTTLDTNAIIVTTSIQLGAVLLTDLISIPLEKKLGQADVMAAWKRYPRDFLAIVLTSFIWLVSFSVQIHNKYAEYCESAPDDTLHLVLFLGPKAFMYLGLFITALVGRALLKKEIKRQLESEPVVIAGRVASIKRQQIDILGDVEM